MYIYYIYIIYIYIYICIHTGIYARCSKKNFTFFKITINHYSLPFKAKKTTCLKSTYFQTTI